MNLPQAARDGMDLALPYSQLTSGDDQSARFYEFISLNELKGFAQLAGLATGSDIEHLQPLINEASSILEVGAGYGRVLKNILNQQYSGKLFAIERSKNLYLTLIEEFSNTVNIVHSDILTYFPNNKFDLILWLWEGIADFTKDEQPKVIKHLASLLTVQGTLVIDTLSPQLRTINGKKINASNTNCKIRSKDIAMDIYRISPLELYKHAHTIGITDITNILYHTATNRSRVLYFLKK